MKRTVTLALLLTAAICWAQVAVNYMPDENAVRTFGGAAAPPETTTVVFEPYWLASSSSPDYPEAADIDSLVKDTDGTRFLYLQSSFATGDTASAQYSSSAIQTRSTYSEPLPSPENMRIGGIHFDLASLPAGSTILDARLNLYSVNPSSDVALGDLHEFVAVLDTFDLDWSRFYGGSAGGNMSCRSPNAAWANHGVDRWKGGSLVDRTVFSDYGIRQTLAAQGDTIYGGWGSYDVTPLVQAQNTIEGNEDQIIWFMKRGIAGQTGNFTAGSAGTAAAQPFMVVKYVSGPAFDPVDIFLFADNHSQQDHASMITGLLGSPPGDFAISIGDMNATTDIDSVLTYQWATASPAGLGFDNILFLPGNHEYSAGSDELVMYCANSMASFYNSELMGGPLHWRQHGLFDTNQYRPRTNGSFDVGRVHIVLWNPVNKNSELAAPTQADLDWLQQDLEGSGQPTKIVLQHKPCFRFPDMDTGAAIGTADNDTIPGGAAVWASAVSWGMDAWICGHSHKASAEQVSGAWQINMPQMGETLGNDARVGFAVLSIDANGGATVKMYRENAYGDLGTAFTLTKTIRLQ